MADRVIAVDLGGTQLRVALYNDEYEMLARDSQPTDVEAGVEAVLNRLVSSVKQMGQEAGWDRVRAVGIAAPGPLDPEQGVILWGPNLPGWHDVPLVERVEEAVNRPVYLGNDANLAAWAEYRLGAGQGRADMVYITVSTGIGGGLVSGGRLVEGQRGLAGEVGHMTIQADGPRCACGNVGCLEMLASGPAIARRARALVEAGARTAIGDLVGGDLEAITAKTVHEAADGGDVVAVDLFRQASMYLGIGIVNLMYLLNPSVFVIGGGVSKVGDLLFVPMRATVRERIDQAFWENCPIVPAALGKDVGLVGAAIVAKEGGIKE